MFLDLCALNEFNTRREEDYFFRSRREGGGNRLADLFGNDAQGNDATVSKSVSFKYKGSQQKPVEGQTNGTTANITSSQRNVIYQETVQLYN